MITVLAKMNGGEWTPYDWRDGVELKKLGLDEWPVYDDGELPMLTRHLEGAADDALEAGIHAVYRIVRIPDTPSGIDYGFLYQTMMSDLPGIPGTAALAADPDSCGTETWTVENTREPVADAPYGIQIIDVNDERIIWSDGVREWCGQYHYSPIEDGGFCVGQLRIDLEECMRRH